MEQSSSCLFLRIWQEVSKLFIEYLQKSTASPLRHVVSIFARIEYQKDKGNLSHTHLMAKVNWEKLIIEEKEFLDDLICASILDVVRVDEVDHLIDHGIIESSNELDDIIADAATVLGHKCSIRCMKMTSPGVLKCRKINNLHISPDNTKHILKPLPNDYSLECLDRLAKIGLIEIKAINVNGRLSQFKSNNKYFHPKRHIPPTNPTGDINMSPMAAYFFAVCCANRC